MVLPGDSDDAASLPKHQPKSTGRHTTSRYHGTLASILPETQQLFDDAKESDALLDAPDDEQPSADEEDDPDDDNAAHDHGKPEPKKRKKPSTATGKRVNWGKDGTLHLCEAIQTWVLTHSGRLPPVLKTSRGAKVNDAWKEIAGLVPEVAGIEAEKAAKACSLKWTTIRSDLKVSLNRQIRLLISWSVR